MAKHLIRLFLAVALLTGCYDLSFDTDDHLVKELAVMAVHVEPPEIRPGVPIDAEVVFADPGGAGREIWCGWQVDIAELDNKTPVDVVTALSRVKDGGTRLHLPVIWPADDADEELEFYAYIRVYLCTGDWVDPDGFLREGAHPSAKVCKKGSLMVATKSISSIDPVFPQNNPTINGVFFNDALMTPYDDGGETSATCPASGACSTAQSLDLYIGAESLEPFGIATETFISASTGSADVKETSVTAIDEDTIFDLDDTWLNWEIFHVDWYITGGALYPNRSYYPTITHDFLGPFHTTWYPDGPGDYILWAVVRDVRGGNAYDSFRITVE